MKNMVFGVIINTIKSERIYCVMGFIEAYKRLEKLCAEVLDDERRVSAYIDEMINTSRGAYFVRDWDEDLKQLKHYRWIRNQIVHDPCCSEENMCSDADTQWIVDFHARIMNQTDPLALYRKATRPRQKQATKNAEGQYYQEQHQKQYYKTSNRFGCFITLLIVAMVAMVAMIAMIAMIVIWLSR